MAALQQTWSGDLSVEIAGRIMDAVKNISKDKKIDETTASSEVKEAAKKLNKSDSNSIPVKDPELRETISKLFGVKLDAKLLTFEGKIDRTVESVNIIGAGIVDVQKLLVDQNSLLEAKLDEMVKVLTIKNDFLNKEDEDSDEDAEALRIASQGSDYGSRDLLRTVKRGMESPFSGLIRGVLKITRRRLVRFAGKGIWKVSPPVLKSLIRSSKNWARRSLVERPLFWLSNKNVVKGLVNRIGGYGALLKLSQQASVGVKSATQVAAKSGSKIKGLKPVMTSLSKLGSKELVEQASKKGGKRLLSKSATKIAQAKAKMVVRSSAGNLPLVGFGTGLIFSIQRLLEGDPVGAVLEAASGISAGLGFFGVSMGLDVGILGRDISRATGLERGIGYERGMGYEFGSGFTQPGLTVLHGTEAVIGKKDRTNLISSSIDFLSSVFKNSITRVHKMFSGSEINLPTPIPITNSVDRFKTKPKTEKFKNKVETTDNTIGALKTRIREAESADNYNAIYSGAKKGFPGADKDITKMTIQEIYDHQTDYLNYQRDVLQLPEKQRSAAMGAYQLLYVRTAADALGISRDTLFDKETQDKLVMWWIDHPSRANWSAYQSGNISAEEYNNQLAGQFASIKTTDGRGVYDGDGINAAHNDIIDLIKSLKTNDKSYNIIPPLPPVPQSTEMFEKSSILEDMEQLVSSTQPTVVVNNQSFGNVRSSKTNIVILEDNFLEKYRMARLGA